MIQYLSPKDMIKPTLKWEVKKRTKYPCVRLLLPNSKSLWRSDPSIYFNDFQNQKTIRVVMTGWFFLYKKPHINAVFGAMRDIVNDVRTFFSYKFLVSYGSFF